MEKGQLIEIKIEDVSNEGNGIGRFEGMAVFVRGAVFGDFVRAELVQIKKRYAVAETKEILVPSSDRCDPFCTADCGGCAFQGLKYEAQLMLKESQVREKLRRIAGIENPNVLPIIGMEEPFHYRNKAQFQVGERNGQAVVGFYRAKSHTIEECRECGLQSAPAMAAAATLQAFMRSEGLKPYDRRTGKGLIRNLIVKTARNTGEVMVIIVAASKNIPGIEKLVRTMDDAIYDLDGAYSLESVIININKKSGSEIMGEECINVAGKPVIEEEACGLKFEISPLAFYQVNPTQMERLYAKVIEFAGLEGHENVLDLYCGVGTIGLLCSKHMAELCGSPDYERQGKVYGIEAVRGAVLDANRNAVINGIVNAVFKCAKAEDEMEALLDRDVIILDPPRAGCDPKLLEAVCRARPGRIVYVSCDPGTLARDVAILCGAFPKTAYTLECAQPVDMFPHTSSIETVALLSKLQAKEHIEISLDMDEPDLTCAESKATYDEIKKTEIRHHRARELQQAEIRGRQAAPVPSRKGSCHH